LFVGMRSFKQIEVFALVLLCGCSRMNNQATAGTSSSPCAVAATSGKTAETAAALRQSVENGPLYGLLAQSGQTLSCNIKEESGVITLEYRSTKDAWLRVKRNSSIEYTDQELHAASPLSNAIEVLKRTERATFPGGCNIDWQHGETEPSTEDPTAKEVIYRGDTCNCQARIRTKASGGDVGLILRSAC